MLQKSFESLPPCLFIVAELDPLRDDSYGTVDEIEQVMITESFWSLVEYQKKLEQAGVKTKLVLVKEVVHSFFSLPGKCLMFESHRTIRVIFRHLWKSICTSCGSCERIPRWIVSIDILIFLSITPKRIANNKINEKHLLFRTDTRPNGNHLKSNSSKL